MKRFIIIRERGNGCNVTLVYETLDTWEQLKILANKYRNNYTVKENRRFIVIDTTNMVTYKLMDL